MKTLKTLPYDLTPEELTGFTPQWRGERFDDGRPRVPDDILAGIRAYSSITHAWHVCKNAGFFSQVLCGFQSTRPREIMVGRALTALYVPKRPDLRAHMVEAGHARGEIGDMVSWPIMRLQRDDVYVGDVFGKIADGPIIGERLATAVYARSGNGCVHNASVRDIDGILSIEGLNVFHRGMHPSHGSPDTIMLMGINCPVRMEDVTVMPGDVVIARGDCVIFLPPQLAEYCALSGAVVYHQDLFGMQRVREGVYTPGQIDQAWTPDMNEDFECWVDALAAPDFTRERIRAFQALAQQRLW